MNFSWLAGIVEDDTSLITEIVVSVFSSLVSSVTDVIVVIVFSPVVACAC